MKTKSLVYVGLMTSIAFVMTRFLQVPVIGGGYIHLGDSIIYLSAFLMGGMPAAFVGGIGGALSDISAGYTSYWIPTLIIKSVMGLVIAALYNKIKNKKCSMSLSFVFGSIVMVAGYFFAEYFMYGNYIAPLKTVPMNLLQAVFSVPVPLLLTHTLKGKIM